MRRTSILALALLALGATPAAPQGFNLYWDACGPTDGRVQTLFACDANTPPASMFVSVYPRWSMTQFAAATLKLRFEIKGGTIPPWWQTATGQCRQHAIRALRKIEDLVDGRRDGVFFVRLERIDVVVVAAVHQRAVIGTKDALQERLARVAAERVLRHRKRVTGVGERLVFGK